MRFRNNGGVVGPTVSSNTSYGPGVWGIPEFQQRLGAGTWPIDSTATLLADPYYEYTTFLLKAVGANTSQNYSIIDGSSLNATMTRNGDTTQGTFSPYGYDEGYWSNYFDGNTDYLNTPSSTQLQLTGTNYTIEAWVYATSLTSTNSGGPGICFIGDTTSNFSRIQFGFNPTGTINVTQIDSAGVANYDITTSSGIVTTNTWYHLALVKNGSNAFLYVNGTQVGTSAVTGTLSLAANVLYVGLRRASNLLHYWNGYISNFRVVNGTAVYTSAFTPDIRPLSSIANTSLLTCQSNRFKDNSTNAFTITKNGDAKVSTFGPLGTPTNYLDTTNGGSFYFDGTSDFTSTGSNAAYAPGTGDFSVEAWVYFNSTSGSILPICQNDAVGSSTNDKFWIGITGGNLQLGRHAAATSSTTAFSPVTGRWYHIALSRVSGTVYMWIDGESKTVTGSTNFNGVSLGQNGFSVGGMSTPYYLNGYISSFRYNVGSGFTSYSLPTIPPTSQANTKLLLNATNAGILDGSRKVNFYTAGNAQVSTNTFKYDKSVYFDGTGDYLLVPSTLVGDLYQFGTGDFTVECWVRFSALASNRVFIDAWVSGQAASWQMYYASATTKIRWYVGASTILESTTTPLVDTWYHVAVARSGTTIRLFINGTLEATTLSHSTNYNYTAPLALGTQYSTLTNYLNGYLEDVRITKGFARYTSTFTPPVAKFNTF